MVQLVPNVQTFLVEWIFCANCRHSAAVHEKIITFMCNLCPLWLVIRKAKNRVLPVFETSRDKSRQVEVKKFLLLCPSRWYQNIWKQNHTSVLIIKKALWNWIILPILSSNVLTYQGEQVYNCNMCDAIFWDGKYLKKTYCIWTQNPKIKKNMKQIHVLYLWN